MNRQLELEQEFDLKTIELRTSYEHDLLIINRCIDHLKDLQDVRTTEYERTYLKTLNDFERSK